MREITERSKFNRLEMLRCRPGSIFADLHPEEISVGLNVRFDKAEEGRLAVAVTVDYSCIRAMIKRRLLSYTVEVQFEIPQMEHHINITDKGLEIPPRLTTLLLNASIGALRGMLALRTEGTFLSAYPLPLINVSALVSRLTYGSEPDDRAFPIANFVYS